MWNPIKGLKRFAVREFVFSKRNVGAVVAFVALYLNHRGLIVSDTVQADTTDQLVVILSLLWTVATKCMDLYQADRKAIAAENKK